MRSRPATLVALLLFVFSAPAFAGNGDVPVEKRTKLGKYVTAQEAYNAVRAERSSLLFVDTRTRAELAFVGMTNEIDAQVPYVEVSEFWEWDEKTGRFKVEPNQNFARDMEALLKAKGLTKNDRIILMCRSGDRSARAANLLADLGYTNVWTVVDGFEGDLSKEGRRTVNGWKNVGLPWTYQLDKSKVYLPSR